MQIKELIRQLEWCAANNKKGYEAEVELLLHVHEWNASGFYIGVPVKETSTTYDECTVEGVITKHDLTKLVQLNNQLERNDEMICHGCGKPTSIFRKHCDKCEIEFEEKDLFLHHLR